LRAPAGSVPNQRPEMCLRIREEKKKTESGSLYPFIQKGKVLVLGIEVFFFLLLFVNLVKAMAIFLFPCLLLILLLICLRLHIKQENKFVRIILNLYRF